MLLGFDPGRDKCGIAVADAAGMLAEHQVVAAAAAMTTVAAWRSRYAITRLVMGNQTTAQQWQTRLAQEFPDLPITLVDERNSSLEARDRYWQLYPPRGLTRLLPPGMRLPPRPVDDIVAILLIERYLAIQRP
ncbi:MAG: pre-16S rRNA-processing nuclease YqgF [Spirulinaceae cyanobacterium RM2_2_10]|nr:pre-16S rRNA-processing nuclease YqgF [Spirulinaceae cyanobacterium SM2_1_0]NJO19035.1 pre-16S rRNA-processing nuclease YqgF [Spirulinaceae cyanobacterium RM2_2_10]